MTVEWTEHRFAGGVLALDVANTVVLRGDPQRSFDRFDNAGELPRFAAAATQMRAAEIGGAVLVVGDTPAERAGLIKVREATDRLFRGAALGGTMPAPALAGFLSVCAASRDGAPADAGFDATGRPFGGALPLRGAVALSAVSLLPDAGRVRICRNCRWLFLDRSRNGSRRWCDMAVCGNRQKARRHYRRRSARNRDEDAA